jgi:hypothetical protein
MAVIREQDKSLSPETTPGETEMKTIISEHAKATKEHKRKIIQGVSKKRRPLEIKHIVKI